MSSALPCVEFGPFRLFPSQRRLVKQDAHVQLGGRALDLLILLIENAGSIMSKQQLTAEVWPDVTVEESSLRVHIANLRKALGDGRDGANYIANVPGRGYCFVGQVDRRNAALEPISFDPPPERVSGLPRRPARVIGRDDDVRVIAELLASHRFTTIHGPGGIGKTTVALAVAHQEIEQFEDGICFLDLGLLRALDSVPHTMAGSLGLMVQSGDPTSSIIGHLRDRQMLLVLDSCEHVVDSAAAITEAIFQGAARVGILVTSRESLRVEGEHVYALSPLSVPPPDRTISVDQLLEYSSARLFLERAVAGGHRRELSGPDAQIVGSICRKLDGIALAVELAAGRVSTHGLRETAELLDSRMKLLWQGRRTAMPRHQTLNATLEWSHDLIPDRERIVLRRLSVFVGPFTLEEAQSVAADDHTDRGRVVEALADLVGKSLVFIDTHKELRRYRLLDTTRAYSQVKLAESGEADAITRRHALYYQEWLARSESGSPITQQPFNAQGAEHLGNIRAALEWSFSETGDAKLGVQLAASSARLFVGLSLLGECQKWCECALGFLDDATRGSRCEMMLLTELGYSLMFTRGNSEQARSALERAFEIAETLDDGVYQFRLLSGLHMYDRRIGNIAGLLPTALRGEAVARDLGDLTAIVAAQVMKGVSHHLSGNLIEARTALAASLRLPASFDRVGANFFGFHRDPEMVLARTLWLQGFPDQAVETAHAAESLEQHDPVTACLALIWGASVFHWTGDLATVEDYVERLVQHAGEHSLSPYRSVGIGLKGDILVRRGELEAGIRLLRESLNDLHVEKYRLYTPWLSCTLAEGLAADGQLDQALDLMREIAPLSRQTAVYNAPELLRVHGDLLAQATDLRGAESCFLQSLTIAGNQHALSWRLRTSTSFARFLVRQDRLPEARVILDEVYAHFTEGFETADLRRAKALLDELGRHVTD
jgi:predicted ATPase/DNA-binding winged helix-turn-helix (wHTH) protein